MAKLVPSSVPIVCVVAVALGACGRQVPQEEKKTAQTSSALVSGLVAAYGFEEGTGTVTQDASGNGLTGTLEGAMWDRGKFGDALRFNGKTDCVTVSDADVLHLTTGMTLSAWALPTAHLPDWPTIVMKETEGELDYVLYGNSWDNKPSAWLLSDGVENGVEGGDALAETDWTHLAATYDGSTLSIYENGELRGSAAAPPRIDDSSGALRIGCDSVWGEYFAGFIDELRIYNRPLSASEIVADMGTAISPPGPALPLVIGDPSVLPKDDSGNGGLMETQATQLLEPGTIQSLSLYVTAAVGQLRLGIYDASGPGGDPGLKRAETAEFTPVVGWNTVNVVSPALLEPGT